MANKPYTNREIDQFFKSQEEHFKYLREKIDYIKNKVQSIEKETKKTNNRVDKLESWKTGIHMVLGFITVIIIPIIIIIIDEFII